MHTNTMKKMLPYLLLATLLFYGVPSLAVNIKEGAKSLMVLGLLAVNTIYCFISGLLFTLRNGFRWYYPILLGILFVPAVTAFYNSSATIYVFAYMLLAAAGSGFGVLFNKTTPNK